MANHRIKHALRGFLSSLLFPRRAGENRVVQLSEEETVRRCATRIRNSIEIRIGERAVPPLPTGASKFGGCPDLPEGTEWPFSNPRDCREFHPASLNALREETMRELGLPREEPPKPGPMTLLAQINLADVHPLDVQNELPERGMLYFFYDPAPEVVWFSQSVDEKRPGVMKVLFESGDFSGFQRREWPEELPEEYRFSECPLTFSSEKMLPNDEDFSIYGREPADGGARLKPAENYDEIATSLGVLSPTGRYEAPGRAGEPFLHLLGYADLIQGPIAASLEGRFHAAAQSGLPLEASDGWRLDGASEWVLLFQFDSIWEAEIVRRTGSELCLDDAGRLYFYIRRDDLQNRRFERTLMELQCG